MDTQSGSTRKRIGASVLLPIMLSGVAIFVIGVVMTLPATTPLSLLSVLLALVSLLLLAMRLVSWIRVESRSQLSREHTVPEEPFLGHPEDWRFVVATILLLASTVLATILSYNVMSKQQRRRISVTPTQRVLSTTAKVPTPYPATPSRATQESATPTRVQQPPTIAKPTPSSAPLSSPTFTPYLPVVKRPYTMATVTATPSLPPTLTPLALPSTPTATPLPVSFLLIAEVHLRTSTTVSLNEEYVVLLNFGPKVDLTDWRLSDSEGSAFEFESFYLTTGTGVRIHTGAGEDSLVDLYWGRSSSVWNPEGDVATLEDNEGYIVDQFSY